MLPKTSYKTKQFLLGVIKMGLVVSAFYVIYIKLTDHRNATFDDFERISTSFSTISSLSFFVLLVLSLLNWFFEILKWQILIQRLSKISFREATAQTLGALTASLPTPNRIGDYGAKAMSYPKKLRKKIMFLNVVGHMAQMSITTIFGSFGLCYVLYHFQPSFNYFNLVAWLMGIVAGGILCMVTLKYHKLERLIQFVRKRCTILRDFSPSEFFNILGCALARYLIFSFQFYYLLLIFGAELHVVAAFATISSMYLISSVVPSVFLFDVIIKGGVAVYLFVFIGVPTAITASVVMLMWIFNFVFPSMIGSYYVLTFKLPKAVS